jgi:phosphoribosylamine--glycine ligase
MDILVLGNGGREHALCWKLRQSPSVTRLLCAPGNAGIASVAECVELAITDPAAVTAFARDNAIRLVVVGPEGPLVAGVVDALRAAGIAVLGPTAAAAQLEGSKGFTKALALGAGIPTAAYRYFAKADAARDYVAAHALPVVVKADGLAAGKGVTVAQSHTEALAALAEIDGPVVIEECMVGPEASLFALTDGKTVSIWPSAQDFKRAGDGDTGPNTGGLGAVSPAPTLSDEMRERAVAEIIKPTLAAMAAAGTPFTGFLYAGLMLTADGPKLIEYNTRLGDPETQVLMLRFVGDLAELLLASAEGRQHEATAAWSEDTAVTVVLAAEGYPAKPRLGDVLTGIDAAEAGGAYVFQAGTRRDAGGAIVSAGGRILAVTAIGSDSSAARAVAYAGIARIDCRNSFFRRDIALVAG